MKTSTGNAPPECILITGASSGLGAALANHYAAPGRLLALTGRDSARLTRTAVQCREAGAEVMTAMLDVCDERAMEEFVAEVWDRRAIDLLIANAGVSAGTGAKFEPDEQAHRITKINIEGVLNSVLPALARMRERRGGQIAMVSSVAGYIGFPGAPAYSASKAWVKAWGQALRGSHRRFGVKVNVVCPGFVRTPMTANNRFHMPFILEPEAAARKIARGLATNQGRIAFPWPLVGIVWWLGTLPAWLSGALLRGLPPKAAD